MRENPCVVLALARRYRINSVAFEWPQELERVARTYLESGDLALEGLSGPADVFFWGDDGRITAGHFAMLRALQPDELVCFDSLGDGSWSSRDEAMAEQFLSRHSTGVATLVIAGNLHTRRDEHEHGIPLGYHIASECPAVAEALIVARSGTFWNMGEKRIGDPLPDGPVIGDLAGRSKDPVWPSSMAPRPDTVVMMLPVARTATLPRTAGRKSRAP